LQWVDWPSWSVPPGAFTSPNAIFGDGGGDTRYVMNTILRGEPVLEGKLSEPNQYGRIQTGLGPNEGAVSISINAVTGVSGFILPGNYVAILLTHDKNGSTVSDVLLQRIRVLAIDQINNTEAASPRVGSTATVAVTTRQAQVLTLARQKGSLSLILRNKDAPEEETTPFDERELNGPLTPDGKPQKTIKVRKGGVVEEVPID
jgi:pilus assembly protein CpaB